MTDAADAREVLFGAPRPRQNGAGATILLLDSGIDARLDLGGRLRNLAQSRGGDFSERGDSHAYRGATLCAEGCEAATWPGGPLGIAPGASVLSDRYADVAPEEMRSFLQHLAAAHGPIDITGHAYSFPETYALRTTAAAQLSAACELDGSERSLAIAAAGHDGPGVLRYPAGAEGVLAVGTCDAEGRPSHYCGRDAARKKPELLVPDLAYRARREDGQLGSLTGTSAAVAVTAGLAALWCEELRARGCAPHPQMLKAILLATGRPALDFAPSRVVCGAALLTPEHVGVWSETCDGARSWTLEIDATPDEMVSLALLTSHVERPPDWVAAPLPIRVSGDVEPHDDLDWTVISFLPRQRQSRLRLEVGAGTHRLTVAAHGCTGVHAQKRRPQRSPRKGRLVVGLSASHDASACILEDGRVSCAIQLERLTRQKHDGRPYLHSERALRYCLEARGRTLGDVDAFAYNIQPIVPGYAGMSQPVADLGFRAFDPFGSASYHVSHHLAHAFAAFHGSPGDAAMVFVADGSGGSTVAARDLVLEGPRFLAYLRGGVDDRPPLHVQSVYAFDPNGYRLLDRHVARSFNPRCGASSWGEVFAAASQFIFGNWQEGSGKLMGLSPYGSPDEFGPSLLQRDAGGSLQFRPLWDAFVTAAERPKQPMDFRHLAARIQRDLEIALTDWLVTSLQKFGPAAHVAYSGGLALNSVANDKLARAANVDSFSIFPASSDAGIAIGAAAAADHVLTGTTRHIPPESDFFGYPYTSVDIQAALHGFRDVVRVAPLALDDVVERLLAQQVVGWFVGGCEFGPRALGHRSILADPRDRRMWTYINRRIKAREDFRPFAPMVVAERAHEFFELGGDSPYMMRVVDVRAPYRAALQAITHVDGSARVQTVRQAEQPRLHELLHRFGARTGLPILLNTSLNVRGEPIVETPAQAVELLLATHLDALVLGDQCATVKTFPEGRIQGGDVAKLGPRVHIVCETRASGSRWRLIDAARAAEETPLHAWQAQLLSQIDGVQPVASLLASQPVAADDLLTFLQAMAHLRHVLPAQIAPREPPERRGAAPNREGRRCTGIDAIAVAADRDPTAVPGSRTKPVDATLRAIKRQVTRLGISRIADLTGYDILGIPVVGALRPQVDSHQITATQGKGESLEQATVSALMEAAERHAANHVRHTQVASVAELTARGEGCCPPKRLGHAIATAARLEWVRARNLRDAASVWIPAAAVFFPYVAPAGTERPLRPSTTGLASGNTPLEATLQAVCEVIERDAVSRRAAGRALGARVDPHCLTDPIAVQWLQRFQQAGVSTCIIEVCASALPVFECLTWQPEGPLASVIVAGQGCALCPQLALRRALLEAAQSRVVAIQGSREDLIRHAGDWCRDMEHARDAWQQIMAVAPREHGRATTKAPPLPTSLVGCLDAALGRLEEAGISDVYVADLSDAALGLAVVRVCIPGLVDGIADPFANPFPYLPQAEG